MTQESERGFIVETEPEPTSEEKTAVLAQLRKAIRPPSPPPTEALNLLFEAARHDTDGSQAARNFLFWLAGLPDPTGFDGEGGLELRRLDGEHKAAALEVLGWWAGPTQSDQPLHEILRKLTGRFSRDET
jgi:hypothetical protein